MQAIILAGGEGLRLRPLSLTTPKPMIKIMDKPIIGYVTGLLKKHNIGDITVTLRESHRFSFEHLRSDDSAKALSFCCEEKPLGTAGGIKGITKDCENDFLVIYGDVITDFNLSELIKFHRSHSPYITVGKAKGVDAGIYAVNKAALDFIPDNSFFGMDELLKRLRDEGKEISVFSDDCSFYDIDTLSDFKNLNRAILKGDKILSSLRGESLNITKNVIIRDNSYLEIGATINPPVYIGKNVYIEAGAEIGAFSVIGSNCKIFSNCHTENSVIMANSLISKDTVLKNTIISENTKIKSGATILENTVIGESCIIGENCVVKPDVSIWPHKITEDNKTVYESITNAEIPIKSIFYEDGISGEFGIEITVPVLCRLGLTLSNIYKNSRFAVSTDENAASLMAKNAVISGLMEGGAYVYDLSPEPMPVFREGTGFLSCRCGIYITFKGNKIKLIILDKYGLNICLKDLKTAEALFNSGEFFSAGVKNIREISVIQNLSEIYYKKNLPFEKKTDLKILFYYKTDLKKTENYLSRSAYLYGASPVPIKDKKAVTDAFSVYFTDNGENIIFYNKNGEKLGSDDIFMLKAEIIYNEGIKKIAVPPDVSLKNKKSDITYIRENSLFSYHRRIIKENLGLQKILDFDAVYFIMRLFEFLKDNKDFKL